jgi:hypothetical protein
MSKKYTKDYHAKRVLAVLEKKNTCRVCPGAPHYNGAKNAHKGACDVCMAFVGLPPKTTSFYGCPCHYLTKEEAVKRAWIALETDYQHLLDEGGYLDDDADKNQKM